MENRQVSGLFFWRIVLFIFIYLYIAILLGFSALIGPIKIFIHNNSQALLDIISLFMLILYFKFYEADIWQQINTRPTRVKNLLLIGLGTIVVQFIFQLVILYFLGDQKVIKDHQSYDNLLFTYPKHGSVLLWAFLTVSTISIIAPVFEELFFRGILFTYLRKKVPTFFALILSSVLFGIGHGFEANILWATLLGIFLGWIYFKTGNIFYSISAHYFVNTFNLILFILIAH